MQRRAVTQDDVIRACAQYFSISIKELTGSGRGLGSVRARHIAMFLCRELVGSSLTEIGDAFHRFHGAVSNAISQVRKRLYSEPSYAHAIAAICDELGFSPHDLLLLATPTDSQAGLVALHGETSSQDPLLRGLARARNVDLALITGRNFLANFRHQLCAAIVDRGCAARVIVSDPRSPVMTDDVMRSALCPGIDIKAELQKSLTCLRSLQLHLEQHNGKGLGQLTVRLRWSAPTCNMIIIDNTVARVTPLLPYMHSEEAPTFDFIRQPDGLFERYASAFSRLWSEASSRHLDDYLDGDNPRDHSGRVTTNLGALPGENDNQKW